MRNRDCTKADAAAVARIYNQGIAARRTTFETEPRDAADVLRWLDSRFPVVVVESHDAVVAFAVATEYSPRPCYAGIADFSVYVDEAHRGKGAGKRAVEALLEACAARGFHKVVGRVFACNHASRRMLSRLGFREVGVHERHAQLDGTWHDIVVVERATINP